MDPTKQACPKCLPVVEKLKKERDVARDAYGRSAWRATRPIYTADPGGRSALVHRMMLGTFEVKATLPRDLSSAEAKLVCAWLTSLAVEWKKP